MSVRHVTAEGRIVWGSAVTPQNVTDKNGAKLKNDAGEDRTKISFGLALPKGDAANALCAAIEQAAVEVFPKGTPDRFSRKYKDGDTAVDRNGTPFRELPGRAGCYIFALSTEAVGMVKCYEFDNSEQCWRDSDRIKCGDYVKVEVDCVGNKPDDPSFTPGVYLNPMVVALYREGAEIKSAGGGSDPNRTDAFAKPPVQEAPSTPPASTPSDGAPPRHDEFFNGPKPDA